MHLALPERNDALAVILKLPGDLCNINCHYCYERRKDYDEGRFLTPATLTQFLELAGDRPLKFVLHGGEPLVIGRERCRDLLRVMKRHRGPFAISLQTNGVLLDDRWMDLFEDEAPDMDIALSFDGDEIASEHRVDFRDRSAFHRIRRAFDVVARRGWDVAAIATVTRKALGREREIVQAFLDLPSVKTLKFSPVFDFNVRSAKYSKANFRTIIALNADGKGVPGWAITPDEYARFIEATWAAWRDARAYRSFVMDPHLSMMRTLAGKAVRYTHYSVRKEPFIVTLYPDGTLGSSDEFDYEQGVIGHLDDISSLDEVIQYQQNPHLKSTCERLLQKCSGCRHETNCLGGSLYVRSKYEGTDLEEEYCGSRRKMLDHILGEVARFSAEVKQHWAPK